MPTVALSELQMLNVQNSVPVNFAGNPALAIPIALAHKDFTTTRLQLVGPRLSEADLLNAAQLRFRRSLPESTISSFLTAGDIYSGLGCQRVPITECIIAIIEDDSSFRRALERLVRASGFEAHGFASAEEFLGSAAPGSHACLILDIHLPGMSGLDLLDHLIASCRPRPAVLITGKDQNDLRDRASFIPNSVYLPKPFLSTLLLHAVRSQVKRGD